MTTLPVYTLHREQIVAQPLDAVFPFFERPENLSVITPPALDFQLLTPSPVPMNQGRIIDYTLRLLTRRVRWRSVISTYEPPYCFVDEQLKGPYSFWHHTHRFAHCAAGTHLHDTVRYALPAWLPMPIARSLHAAYVKPTLEKIFDFRAQVYRQKFGPPLTGKHGLDPEHLERAV